MVALGQATGRALDSSWEPRSVAVRGSAEGSTRAGGGLGPGFKFGSQDQSWYAGVRFVALGRAAGRARDSSLGAKISCGYARSGRGGGQSESREGALGGEKCAMISHVASGCG